MKNMFTLMILLHLYSAYFSIWGANEKIEIQREINDVDDIDGDKSRGNKELIQYIKNKYEKTLYGLTHLFYPSRNPTKLYIIFSGGVKNKYSMWSWFWDGEEKWDKTAFLFLKDDTTRWYIGNNQSLIPSYTTLINHYLQKYDFKSKQVFTIGGSMGGYAALYYGMKFNVGAIFAYKSQIDFVNASGHFYVEGLDEYWIDLNDMARNCSNLPKIYLNYGNYPPDKRAAQQFIDTLKQISSFFIIHKTSNNHHSGFYPSKDYIVTTLNYLEKMEQDQSIQLIN